MKRYRWKDIGLIVACLLAAVPARGDSIWDRRDQRAAYLHMDNRARRVGDVLTVLLNENTGATNKEQRKMSKDTSASGKFDFAGKASGKTAEASASIDQSADRSFQGAAEYESNRQLQDTIPVMVVDVMPNGNLVVEGRRLRKVSNETRWLRINGIVRPNDIDIANTIMSQQILNPTVVYEGGGVESRFTNQGWLGRFTNKVWPF